MLKTENEMRYAVYANVVLGKQLSGRMSEAKHVNTDSSSQLVHWPLLLMEEKS